MTDRRILIKRNRATPKSQNSRPCTINPKRHGLETRNKLKREHEETLRELVKMKISLSKPKKYGECLESGLGSVHPCPWISCAHHLAIDVTPINIRGGGGSIVYLFPDLVDNDGVPDIAAIHAKYGTCSLNIADKHPDGMSTTEVGAIINISRAGVSMIEFESLVAVRDIPEFSRLRDMTHDSEYKHPLDEIFY